MRVAGWRIDGFGVLAGLVVEDLPEGLTVIEGPNEAGKSTLRAFLAQVLFGFPPRQAGGHPPLHGGRHGGAVMLVDEAGRHWVLERHAGEREAVVTAPDGRRADVSVLRSLLGGFDAALFESVFAFGLDELASLGRLDQGELRDQLFSAGIAGAGRRATSALRALEQRQGLLVRPRQREAVANALAARLGELDTALAGARRHAERHPAAAEALARLDERVDVARRRREAAEERLAGLARRLGARDAGRAAGDPAAAHRPGRDAPALALGVVGGVLAAVALVGTGSHQAGATGAMLGAGLLASAAALLLARRARRARTAAKAEARLRAHRDKTARAVDQELETTRDELDAAGTSLAELLEARASARSALKALETSDEIAALELERAGVEDELAAALERWRVLGLAKALIARTLQRYEAERQPDVLQRAGARFAAVTDGRYRRVVAPVGTSAGAGLEVISATGGRVDAGRLSRGAAEQLYLCIRLALVEQLAAHATALPLVLDDVLVDFDPERAWAVARCLAEMARRHQVLALTCHPEHVALLLEAAPGARLVSLRRR